MRAPTPSTMRRTTSSRWGADVDLVWETPSGELEAMTFDATPREVHGGTSTPTEHPIEGGASAADHVKVGGWKGSFECFVSDSPSEEPLTQMFGTRGRVAGATLSAKRRQMKTGASKSKGATYEDRASNATANVLSFDGPVARRERVLEQLELLRTSRTLVTATMILGTRENCIVASVGAPLTSKDGDGVVFGLELAQLRFAETQIVELPEPEEPRGRRPVDGGGVSASEASPELQSVAYGALFP